MRLTNPPEAGTGDIPDVNEAASENLPSGAGGISRRAFVGGVGAAGALLFVNSPDAAASTAGDEYVIRWDRPHQTILGLGFEIQSDSIGSGNDGLPEATTSVPHDLVYGERDRLFHEMLRAGGDRGFRYCRLALGLYLRGLTPDKKNIRGRWPEQMDELRQMMVESRLEGLEAEYWSPAPYWKSNGSYIGGTLKSTDGAFLAEFGKALVRDVEYLEDHGLPVAWWGLQNEPRLPTSYSSCVYNADLYYAAFSNAACRLRSQHPDIRIHANSQEGQRGPGCNQMIADPRTLTLVDGWSWHRIGLDSDDQLNRDFRDGAHNRTVFDNEFEYLSWDVDQTPWYTVNTAQSIMNWMVFQDSPTWFWLHALKPTYNSEALGYSLGFWRPWDDNDFSRFPNIAKGHWDWNPMNWNGVAGFLRHMPWDSVRYEVEEPQTRSDQRAMAWAAPTGHRTLAITNRTDKPFSYTFDVGSEKVFTGSRYAHDVNAKYLGEKKGPRLVMTVPAMSIEFWTAPPA